MSGSCRLPNSSAVWVTFCTSSAFPAACVHAVKHGSPKANACKATAWRARETHMQLLVHLCLCSWMPVVMQLLAINRSNLPQNTYEVLCIKTESREVAE